MFNVRIKQFYDTEQIQIFDRSFHSKGEVEKNLNCNHVTGEIWEKHNPSELLENPFTETEEHFELFDMNFVDEQKRSESIRISTNRTIKAIYDIARSNVWDWFVTFTFNPEKVNRYDYSDCTSKLSNWLKRMGKLCPNMKYLIVPELHQDGAFHFHGLFSNCAGMDFVDSGIRDNKGRTVYNVGKYRFGFTTATIVSYNHSVTSYLCKYVTKDLCAMTFGKKRYWASRNVNRPEVYEYLSRDSLEEILSKFIDGDYHLKMTESAYGNCIYIDKPIE